ncbi:uncharacterized protein SPPG_00742, partial [Spizellomyces punctatus DAOM BR117]
MSSQSSFPPAFLEILPNVRSLTISINESPERLPVEKLKFQEKSISYTPNEQDPPQILSLPVSIDPRSATTTVKSENVDLKFSLRSSLDDYKSRSATDPGAAIKAFQGLTQIHCQTCKTAFLPTSSPDEASEQAHHFRRIIDMPSEYWHELTDCWACHREDYSQLPGQKAGVILAQRHAVLVARSYVVLHPEDVDLPRLSVDLAGANKGSLRLGRYAPALCASCQQPVGECYFDEIPQDATNIAEHIRGVKLFRYWVDFVVADTASSPLTTEKDALNRTFVSFFADDLLESADAHASYRFIIQTQGSDEPRLLLWILNWNMAVSTNTPVHDILDPTMDATSLERVLSIYTQNLGHSEKMHPAMKILYLDCSQSVTSAQESIVTSWRGNGQVESISLHPSLHDQVLTALRVSTAYLPPAKRDLNGFKVGFILR